MKNVEISKRLSNWIICAKNATLEKTRNRAKNDKRKNGKMNDVHQMLSY